MTLETFILNILLIGVIHWFFDFILQTEWQATNKSKNNVALTRHVLVYSIPWLLFGIWFCLINFAVHWITDYFTSRKSSKFFADKKFGKAFAVIGADQEIHRITLILSFYFVGNPLI